MGFFEARGGASGARKERRSRLRRQEDETEVEDETGILFMGEEEEGDDEPMPSSSQSPRSAAAAVGDADRDSKAGVAETARDETASDTEEEDERGGSPLRVDTTEQQEASSSSSSLSDSGDDSQEESGDAPPAEAEDSDEGDDPVVREIDVYLRRLDVSGSASVYVLQYPLRPLYRPYGDQGQLLEVAYREKQRTLHFTYGLNTRGENFDPNHPMNLEAEKNAASLSTADASSTFGGSSRRKDLPGEHEREKETMPRHVLKSQRAAAGDCSYAVGILKQDKLFITPVDHVLQFRPDFSQVDRLAAQSQQQSSRSSAHASAPKSAAAGTPPTGDATGSADSAMTSGESRGSGRAATEDERGDGKTKGGGGSGIARHAGEDAAKGKLGGAPMAGSGPGGMGVGAGVSMSAGQGRTRMSHSKQRDVEEAEEWLPVETFYDAETPEAFDIIRTLCSTVGVADEEQEMHKDNEPEDLLADLSDSKDARDAESAVPKLPPPKPVVEDILFVADTQSYLRRLCGNGSTSGGSESGGGIFGLQSAAAAAHQAVGPLGYGALAKLSPDQQVFTILRHRHVESFSTIRRLLTVAMTETELLRVLLQYGILVLGNWAIKSLYVYDDMYDISCRDLLLALLIRNGGGGALGGGGTGAQPGGAAGVGAASTAAGGLPKEAFRSATRLPMEKVNQMMQEVAVCSCSAWHLKLPPDTAFAAAHPSIQKHFDQWWRQRLQQVVKEIHQRRDAAFNANYGGNQQKPSGSSGGTSSENGAAGGGAAVSPALLQLAGRVCSSALASQGAMTLSELRSMIDKKNGDFASISDRDLERVLQTVAIQVGKVWLSPKVGNAQIDVFRDALITMFRKQTQPQSKAQIIQELGQTLKRRVDLPDFTLRKLLRELAVNEGGLWSFKGRVAESEEEMRDVPEAFS